ncbi:MAG TPA: SRPBCC domain-containing protein [Oculatellaceae cyanobacterium]
MSISLNTGLTIKCSTYINAPIDKVFHTITTAEEWNSWFTKEMILEARAGGKIQFIWRDYGVHHLDVEDGGTVIEVIPNSRFTFTWHIDSSPTTVTFNLKQLGKGTVVDLSDAGYKPEEIMHESAFHDCCCGWGEALTLLKFYLEHGATYGTVPHANSENEANR